VYEMAAAFAVTVGALSAQPSAQIPPAAAVRPDHPRLLLRPKATPLAVSLDALRGMKRDTEFAAMLARLRSEKSAMALAMLHLVDGSRAAADKAVAAMRAFECPKSPTAFTVYFGLRDLAFAYDWLWTYEGFTDEMKAEVRRRAVPLVQAGLRIGDDHLFHNYVWMSNGGLTLWALATAGDDPDATRLLDALRQRLNDRLYPGMEYLAGAPGEPLWYWALYDFSPAALTVLAAQSAYETPLVAGIEAHGNRWLSRQFANVLHNTQPDMTYVTWGDTKVGPDGGVTHEMAGVLDAVTWALAGAQAPEADAGAFFSRWLAAKRGPARFYGDTVVFYFLYTRQLPHAPNPPSLAFRAGGTHGGNVVTRSAWTDDATVVGFRSTDHFGDHNHFDQGSFTIFHQGPLAIDPPAYRKVGGPQQKTDVHNTLLIGGQGQRPVRGQNFRTLDEFKQNLTAGARLETGDLAFYRDEPGWTAVAGEFAQAYEPGLLRHCVRQLIFVRPNLVAVVDRLQAPEGKSLPEVQWLLNLPGKPIVEEGVVSVANRASWLRCRALSPMKTPPAAAESLDKSWRVTFTAAGGQDVTLVHVLDLGDGRVPSLAPPAASFDRAARVLCLSLAGRTFLCSPEPPFEVTPVTAPASMESSNGPR
jgi:hypothetical protein